MSNIKQHELLRAHETTESGCFGWLDNRKWVVWPKNDPVENMYQNQKSVFGRPSAMFSRGSLFNTTRAVSLQYMTLGLAHWRFALDRVVIILPLGAQVTYIVTSSHKSSYLLKKRPCGIQHEWFDWNSDCQNYYNITYMLGYDVVSAGLSWFIIFQNKYSFFWFFC